MAGISFDNESVIVDGVVASFNDLYKASVASGNTKVTKLSYAYVIDANIILKNNAIIQDTNVSATINGEYFQIPSGCKLILGVKYSSTQVSYGCVLNMPNVIPEFGFGGINPSDSGDLMLYGCIINIYSYWSFFNGYNYVDIIGCQIDGYGKVSGKSSNVKNNTFKRAHGKYGTLLFRDAINSYSNNVVLTVEPCANQDMLPDLNNMFTIDKYSGTDAIEIFYGTYYGYSDFLHVLDSVYNTPIYLYGTNVNNGYGISRSDPNKNDFYHKFKFKPRFQNQDGVILKSIPVTITNRLGQVEFSGTTDTNGYLDKWLTYYQDLADPTPGEILTPHTIKIAYGGAFLTTTVVVDRNMDDFPLIIFTSSSGSSDIDVSGLEEFISSKVNDAVSSLKSDIDIVDENVKTLMGGLGAQLKETKVTIVRNGVKMTI